MNIRAIDVSSYQPRDLTALIAAENAEHVVVRMYLPGELPPQQHSRDQAASARANGCTVGAYFWAYRDFDPRTSVDHALALAAECGMDPPPVLWIDMELYGNAQHPSVDWLRAAVDECRLADVRPGLYSGGWFWRGYMGNTQDFADLPLWVSQYDGLPDVDVVTLFGGWTAAAGKQYAADTVDHDVFREEVTMAGTQLTDDQRAALAKLEALGAGSQSIDDWLSRLGRAAEIGRALQAAKRLPRSLRPLADELAAMG